MQWWPWRGSRWYDDGDLLKIIWLNDQNLIERVCRAMIWYDQNLFERVCRAVMTMRWISVIWWWWSYDHMIIRSYDQTCLKEYAVPWWPWEEFQCRGRRRWQRPTSKLCSERLVGAPGIINDIDDDDGEDENIDKDDTDDDDDHDQNQSCALSVTWIIFQI